MSKPTPFPAVHRAANEQAAVRAAEARSASDAAGDFLADLDELVAP